MTPDYRALCAELVDDLEKWVDGYLITDPEDEHTAASFERINRARAALAAEPQGATDEELQDLWDAQDFGRSGVIARYARGVLARWGAVDCSQPPPDDA
jgi:hypothetical protein